MEIEEKGVKLRLTIVDTPGMKSYLLTLVSHRFGHVEYLLLFSEGKCSGKISENVRYSKFDMDKTAIKFKREC